MLEIIFVITLWKKMGEKMRAKGYEKPLWFQLFVPVFWVGGEFFGAFVYAVIRALRGQQNSGFDFLLYLAALVGAALGATGIFLITSCFSSRLKTPPPLPNQ
jgi:hypothetical protein